MSIFVLLAAAAAGVDVGYIAAQRQRFAAKMPPFQDGQVAAQKAIPLIVELVQSREAARTHLLTLQGMQKAAQDAKIQAGIERHARIRATLANIVDGRRVARPAFEAWCAQQAQRRERERRAEEREAAKQRRAAAEAARQAEHQRRQQEERARAIEAAARQKVEAERRLRERADQLQRRRTRRGRTT